MYLNNICIWTTFTHVILLQCNLGFSSSEDLLGEGFAGTNVIAIRLEALGDPSSNSPEDLALLRRRRETDNDTASQDSGKIPNGFKCFLKEHSVSAFVKNWSAMQPKTPLSLYIHLCPRYSPYEVKCCYIKRTHWHTLRCQLNESTQLSF